MSLEMTYRSVVRAMVVVAKAASLIAVCAYFVLTVLYVAPMNPLKPHAQRLVTRTIARWMPQNWSLFAPSPACQNLVLEVAYLTREQRREWVLSDDAVENAAWIDLTTPLIEEFHRNRLSGADRFSRPADTAMREVLSGGPELVPWGDACSQGDELSCLVLNEVATRLRVVGLESLRRIASAACLDLHGDCKRISHVALRIRIEEEVPWSRRNSDDERPVRTHSLGVHPHLDGLVAPQLYEAVGT